MNQPSYDMFTPERVARLLDVDDAARWSDADAAAALVQQLAAPLLPDLFAAPGAEATRLAMMLAGGKTLRECSFIEALVSPRTSAEIWQHIKAWAKDVRGQATHPLADGPATVLYYAAIAAALRAGEKITTLTDGQLRDGFIWSCRQAGAETLTPLFDDALSRVKGS